MMLLVVGFCLVFLASKTVGYLGCYDPTPAFIPPKYDRSQHTLKDAFKTIEQELDSLIANGNYNTTSYSIEVTSSKGTLWSSFHTAQEQDSARPGAKQVTGKSAYRVASITKVFTVLGILQQQVEGTLRLDEPVDKYLTELKGAQAGTIPWKDITLRSLASQLSGIPRSWSPDDIVTNVEDPTDFGLPPRTGSTRPNCDAVHEHHGPCSAADLLSAVKEMRPLFAPNQQSTYSNTAFELLGLVLANVTGMSYEEYITKCILEPLGMSDTSFMAPPDSASVLPKGQSWYWNVDQGVHKPTGGLYSTTTDHSIFLRYILTHYNGLHAGLNWLQPASFSPGTHSSYSMPWETFRTASILPHSSRPINFFTKGGGVPGYTTIIMLIPDYDLAVSIFTAGSTELLFPVVEAVTTRLLRAADEVAFQQLQARYAGTYTAVASSSSSSPSAKLNSSITLSSTPELGLHVTRFVSNGTDMFASALGAAFLGSPEAGFHAQLIPTLLYADETRKRGELWRVVSVPPRKGAEEKKAVWDDFCVTELYGPRYDGKPLTEFVFWDSDGGDGDGAPVAELELTAFRVVLRRKSREDKGLLVLQEGPPEEDNS